MITDPLNQNGDADSALASSDQSSIASAAKEEVLSTKEDQTSTLGPQPASASARHRNGKAARLPKE